MFRGIVDQAAVDAVERKRGITLMPDPRNLLAAVNKSPLSILAAPSLAGTGKTTIMQILLDILLPTFAGTKKAAFIMVPSRSLRDDVVQSFAAIFADEELKKKVLWLGRPQTSGEVLMWEKTLQDRVDETLRHELDQLKNIEKT